MEVSTLMRSLSCKRRREQDIAV